MKKRSKLLPIVMAGTLLCACSSGQPQAEETAKATTQAAAETAATTAAEAATEAAVQTPDEKEAVNLDVWYALSGTSGEAFLSIVDDFNALNTGITITASYSGGYNDTSTKITGALSSNTTPDVLIGGQVTYTGAYGNFFAGEMAKSDAEFDFDDVYEGLWEYGRYNGEICNIPYGISTNTMFYNKELAAGAGVDLEANPPATWAEFMEVCKTIKAAYPDKEEFVPFIVSDQDWLTKTQLLQCNNPVIAHNEDYSEKTAAWGVEECAKVAQWWQDMVREGTMDMTMNQNGTNIFSAGNAAFFAGSSTKIIEWSDLMGENLGAIEMPIFDKQAVAMGGNTISIFPSEDEARAQAAWTFVKYVTSTEANAKFAVNSGYMPIRLSAAETAEVKDAISRMPVYAVANKQLAYAYAYTNIDDYAALATALDSARVKVTEDLEYDALTAMQEAAEMYDEEANY